MKKILFSLLFLTLVVISRPSYSFAYTTPTGGLDGGSYGASVTRVGDTLNFSNFQGIASYGWFAHYDAIGLDLTPDVAGTYKISYSRDNGATWQSARNADNTCAGTYVNPTTGVSDLFCTMLFAPSVQVTQNQSTLNANMSEWPANFKIKVDIPSASALGTNTYALTIWSFADLDNIYPALESVVTCDSLDLVCRGTEVLKFIFGIDQEFAEDKFSEMYDNVVAKAPFAYVFAVLDTDLSPVATSSAPSISIPLLAEYQGHTIIDQSMDWTDSGGVISNLVGMIRPAFTILLWLTLIIYVWSTVRHII